jgi:hypothetical protein
VAINAYSNPLKKLLPLNVIETIRALLRLLLHEVDSLPYKLLLLLVLQPPPSSYVASIAKTIVKPLRQEKDKLIYDGGTGSLIVMVKNALLHYP